MNHKYVLASGSDQGYFPGLIVSVLSILQNSERLLKASVDVHILDGGIEPESWDLLVNEVKGLNPRAQVIQHSIDFPEWKDVPKIWGNSMMAYARLWLPELVDEKQIIYFDSDILLLADMGELFDRPFEDGVSTYACVDAKTKWLKNDCKWLASEDLEGIPYFNSGVLKIDLQAWRDIGVTNACKEELLRNPEFCTFWDQSLLNFILKGKWKSLEYHFNANVFSFHHFLEDAEVARCNLHYVTSRKPWNTYSRCAEFKIWNKYLENRLPQIAALGLGKEEISKTRMRYLQKAALENSSFVRLFYTSALAILRKLKPSTVAKTDYVYHHWKSFDKDENRKGMIDPRRAKELVRYLESCWSN